MNERGGDGRAVTEAELVEWGRRLGQHLDPPAIVALTGDLGAGKTTLARAICAGYGVRESVTSPTFALVHAYDASRSVVYHVDLYRLDGPRDLQNIGWDDMLCERALLIIEWPERAEGSLPSERLRIELRFVAGDPDRRTLVEGAAAAVAR